MKQIKTKEFLRLLSKAGFVLDRTKGSHSIFVNSKGEHVSVPRNLHSVIALRLIKEYDLQ